MDGTDLGDVAALVGVSYDLGMEGRAKSGEAIAPVEANDIIQDFTYAAILKNYGEGTDHTIAKPAGYDPTVFRCACQHECQEEGVHPCQTMLDYGKLPNGKYMINWPIAGNDYYANMVELEPEERHAIYQAAKDHTLGFVYYIQHELGYKHLGLADDEFPTDDLLPLMPYHREGRRIEGEVRLNVGHIVQPFDYNLYRTGVAVGDYPIDHHHDMNPAAPAIDFPPVPSFNIPMGCLIPAEVKHLLVADKAISVSNIVNGASRLQPVILQIGQVAGLLAAMAAKEEVSPSELDIRNVQDSLLAHGGYLMPYMDVPPDDPSFAAIQRVGATGILKGKGIPYKWANQTRFYPDTTLSAQDLIPELQLWAPAISFTEVEANTALSGEVLIALLQPLLNAEDDVLSAIAACQGGEYDPQQPLRKACVAAIIDRFLDPFHARKIDLEGNYLSN